MPPVKAMMPLVGALPPVLTTPMLKSDPLSITIAAIVACEKDREQWHFR
jgi:hypothetical protein